jgi:steroid delta-isomerase-like uncharacterized protein
MPAILKLAIRFPARLSWAIVSLCRDAMTAGAGAFLSPGDDGPRQTRYVEGGMGIENVKMARRWFEEVWNQRRPDAIDELITEESFCLSELGVLRGKQEFIDKSYSVFLAAFPDLWINVVGTVAEGDQVVVRWTASATHLGDGLGFPATGRKVAFRGMSWFRIQDGKLMEGWDSWNPTGLIESLRAPAEAEETSDV